MLPKNDCCVLSEIKPTFAHSVLLMTVTVDFCRVGLIAVLAII